MCSSWRSAVCSETGWPSAFSRARSVSGHAPPTARRPGRRSRRRPSTPGAARAGGRRGWTRRRRRGGPSRRLPGRTDARAPCGRGAPAEWPPPAWGSTAADRAGPCRPESHVFVASRASCSTAVAIAATSRPTENTSMSWPSCRTSTISRSERTQRTREPAMRRWAARPSARPDRAAAACARPAGCARDRGRRRAGVPPRAGGRGRRTSTGARSRILRRGPARGQEPAAVPVVELARGEAGEAGGAGGREPGLEDVTLEFHACVLHPRDRQRPLEYGDRCNGRTSGA